MSNLLQNSNTAPWIDLYCDSLTLNTMTLNSDLNADFEINLTDIVASDIQTDSLDSNFITNKSITSSSDINADLIDANNGLFDSIDVSSDITADTLYINALITSDVETSTLAGEVINTDRIIVTSDVVTNILTSNSSNGLEQRERTRFTEIGLYESMVSYNSAGLPISGNTSSDNPYDPELRNNYLMTLFDNNSYFNLPDVNFVQISSDHIDETCFKMTFALQYRNATLDWYLLKQSGMILLSPGGSDIAAIGLNDFGDSVTLLNTKNSNLELGANRYIVISETGSPEYSLT